MLLIPLLLVSLLTTQPVLSSRSESSEHSRSPSTPSSQNIKDMRTPSPHSHSPVSFKKKRSNPMARKYWKVGQDKPNFHYTPKRFKKGSFGSCYIGNVTSNDEPDLRGYVSKRLIKGEDTENPQVHLKLNWSTDDKSGQKLTRRLETSNQPVTTSSPNPVTSGQVVGNSQDGKPARFVFSKKQSEAAEESIFCTFTTTTPATTTTTTTSNSSSQPIHIKASLPTRPTLSSPLKVEKTQRLSKFERVINDKDFTNVPLVRGFSSETIKTMHSKAHAALTNSGAKANDVTVTTGIPDSDSCKSDDGTPTVRVAMKVHDCWCAINYFYRNGQLHYTEHFDDDLESLLVKRAITTVLQHKTVGDIELFSNTQNAETNLVKALKLALEDKPMEGCKFYLRRYLLKSGWYSCRLVFEIPKWSGAIDIIDDVPGITSPDLQLGDLAIFRI